MGHSPTWTPVRPAGLLLPLPFACATAYACPTHTHHLPTTHTTPPHTLHFAHHRTYHRTPHRTTTRYARTLRLHHAYPYAAFAGLFNAAFIVCMPCCLLSPSTTRISCYSASLYKHTFVLTPSLLRLRCLGACFMVCPTTPLRACACWRLHAFMHPTTRWGLIPVLFLFAPVGLGVRQAGQASKAGGGRAGQWWGGGGPGEQAVGSLVAAAPVPGWRDWLGC